MSVSKFTPVVWCRKMAEYLLAPMPFSNEPRPSEEEIEKLTEVLMKVDWTKASSEEAEEE